MKKKIRSKLDLVQVHLVQGAVGAPVPLFPAISDHGDDEADNEGGKKKLPRRP